MNAKSGCAGSTYKARITGRQIAKVTWTLDGKRLKGGGTSRSLNAGKLKPGLHVLVARVTFVSKSATKPKSMRAVFVRCARSAIKPAFTG
jgi:hypothetical protein